MVRTVGMEILFRNCGVPLEILHNKKLPYYLASNQNFQSFGQMECTPGLMLVLFMQITLD